MVKKGAGFFSEVRQKTNDRTYTVRSEIDVIQSANSFVSSLGSGGCATNSLSNSQQYFCGQMPVTTCFPPSDVVHKVKAHEQGG